MLLQAYDFLRLHVDHGCDLQIGGSDQWGNITMGVELIRKVCGDEAYGLTTPLVLKPDGTKYGKTESGTVWLDAQRTSPFAMYQFFVNTLDEQVGQLLRFFTFLDHDAISQLDSDTATHPERRQAQKALARAVVAMVHGEAEVARCEEASAALFSEEIAGLSEDMLLAVTEDAPTTELGRAELLDGWPRAGRPARAHRPGQVAGRGSAHHRPGRRLRQQRAPERRRPHPGPLRPAARPLRGAAQGQARRPHRPGHLIRQAWTDAGATGPRPSPCCSSCSDRPWP